MASFKDFTGKYTSEYGDLGIVPQRKKLSMEAPGYFCDDDDGCDGFCPECSRMIRCDAYNELKDEWDSFYM